MADNDETQNADSGKPNGGGKAAPPAPAPSAPAVDEAALAAAQPSTRAAVQAATGTPDNGEPKETIERFISEAWAFFKLETHVVAGAFSTLKEFGINELTREQASAVIDAWQNSPAHQQEDAE